jgi:hypothetical protein
VATQIPDTIALGRHRDFAGRQHDRWVRRFMLVVLFLIPVLALLNLFGQRPLTTTADAASARLSVYSPDRVRGGLLFEARFHITARHELKNAILVLDSGWTEGLSVNTIEPSPLGQASADGRLSLQLGHVPVGKSYVVYMQFQVNPTNIGWHRAQGVDLYDGKQKLLHEDRTLTIFP